MKQLAICAFVTVLTLGTASRIIAYDSGSVATPCVDEGSGNTTERSDTLNGRFCHPFLIVHSVNVSEVAMPLPLSNLSHTNGTSASRRSGKSVSGRGATQTVRR